MKKLIFYAWAILFSQQLISQTSLPAFWSFDGAVPAGWTLSGTGYYTSGVTPLTPPSCKLSGDGQYVMIETFDEMGPVTFSIRGTGSGTWDGSFDLEESVNGASWTNLQHFGTGDISTSSYDHLSAIPNSLSRFVRFYFTDKLSGWNVALDSVGIAEPPPGPAAEIKVIHITANVPNNGTVTHASPVGTNTPLTLTVENLGTTSTLNISSVFISGSAAWGIATPLVSVPPSSNDDLVLNFQPASSGTHTATLTINNNDGNENPFIIYLYGIGGTAATLPTAQPSSLNFPVNKSWRIQAQFSHASPVPDDGYLVLMKKGSPVTDVPVNGTGYVRGDYVGSSQVLSSSLSTSFIPRGIEAGTTYHFAVFSYNGPESFRAYLTTSPLTGNITTPATSFYDPAYYTGINSADTGFVTILHNKINPHSFVYYSDYEETNVEKFHARDTTGGMKYAQCVYTGHNKFYQDPFDWTTDSMSREHTFCSSWMPTYAILQSPSERPEYNDQHNLFPTNMPFANLKRSNYPLGEVVTPTYTYLDGVLGTDSVGHTVYEPRDAQKGNAARAIFYMCSAYNGVDGNLWTLPFYISSIIPYGQDQNVLKKWNYLDLPDGWEMSRNDFVDSLQHNRNPFIDHPEWVCYIDFKTMTYIQDPAVPCADAPSSIVSIRHQPLDFEVYPNPGSHILNVRTSASGAGTIKLFDVTGKLIFDLKADQFPASIFTDHLERGIYFLEVASDGKSGIQKIVLE